MKHIVTFQPSGRRGAVEEGISLLDAAVNLGEPLYAACGGQGVCGKCRVGPVEGTAGPVTEAERSALSPAELADGLRLACQLPVRSDISVNVPEGSGGMRAVVLGGDPDRAFPVEPAVRNLYAELEPPSGSDNSADAERLVAALESRYGLHGLSFGIGPLRSLHGALKAGGWRLTAYVRHGRYIVRVEPGYSPKLLGAAFDVGTTTIAAALCDLETGRVIAEASGNNPLVVMGDDVLSRVSYAMSHAGGLAGMRDLLLDSLNGMLTEMAGRAGEGDTSAVMEAVLVGNPVMHHVLLGLPVDALGVSPFVPAAGRPLEMAAGEAGLDINPGGAVYAPPLVGGFIGSDTTAVMAAVMPLYRGETSLVADIGTNGELVLVHAGLMTAASCATGPALEGAQISCGMRAALGAIERAIVDPDSLEVSFRVIGSDGWSLPGRPSGARGICGSGVVDLVAQMRLAGLIDQTGRIKADAASPRVRAGASGETEFVVAYAAETAAGRDITLTQSDVRAVQLAKAAIAAGIQILLDDAGVAAPDRLVVAGAFGNYLDIRNASAIGMFPGCIPEKAMNAGNAAGDGARAILLSASRRREAEKIAHGMRYVELSTHPDFQGRFLDAMSLP